MDSIEKINKVCKSVLKISDEDFKICDEMAKSQSGYLHPLKQGRQSYFNEMGNNNQKILSALEVLKIAILENEPK